LPLPNGRLPDGEICTVEALLSFVFQKVTRFGSLNVPEVAELLLTMATAPLGVSSTSRGTALIDYSMMKLFVWALPSFCVTKEAMATAKMAAMPLECCWFILVLFSAA
jgi:hypothetical protein